MSTTTDRATATECSGADKKRGRVLEIAAGEVDTGASISFLSQYPGEAEFLLPPLSCLEVPTHPARLPSPPLRSVSSRKPAPPLQLRGAAAEALTRASR